ncbi:SPOSA6832_00937 [Sporobolomyces salmonicolor]|uniref:SPOSA6832_00937-mRNA-1:cds n=1 Tax=Sporidiobolus salmonicolor TaxID=5005 RepID=A0A0D6EHP5_SPOSA|nr:SPOSA6832_00937 [Sporobolomyces salmonicolor]
MDSAAEGRSPSGENPAVLPPAAVDESLLAQLRPPAPYAIVVSGLTITAPIPRWTIPMAVPVTVPMWAQRRLQRTQPLPKELVREVNLEVNPGEVLAILGGSGSGKTTLLNTIAARIGDLGIDGSIIYRPLTPATPSSAGVPSSSPSRPRSKRLSERIHAANYDRSPPTKTKNIIGYVQQHDYLLPYLTVRETLTFAAALRLPRSVSAEQRSAIVEQVIVELGLADAADVIVGGLFRKGISGGERRRLSIGCVLVTLPSVLVLDEPTSGLDSFTAFHLLGTLSRLAKRGRVVVLSIHQPRSDAYALFDKVTLLSQGSVIYSGCRTDMLPHFASLGYTPRERTNPLDFVIDVSSVDNRKDEAEAISRERVGALVVAWREHESRAGQAGIWGRKSTSSACSPAPCIDDGAADAEKGIQRILSGTSGKMGQPERMQAGETRANTLQQVMLLTRRSLLNVSRNYGQSVGFLAQAVIIGVVLGLAFLNPPESPSGIQSLKTVVYFSGPGFFYLSIVVAVFILCQELVIFDREREDNLYSTVPYVLATILGYLPGNVVFPTIYAIIVYFMTGLWREHLAKNLFSFIAQCIMQQQAAWGYAMLAVSINRSFAAASLLANGFSIPFVLASGYIIPHLDGYIRWTQWLSPYFYGFHWIGRLQFTGRTFACEGITGAARNQCDGTNVLVGMRFNLNTPLYVYPLGLLGFILVTYGWATLLLAYFHPGGVKHAAQQAPSEPVGLCGEQEKAEQKTVAANFKTGEKVDVVVDNLQLVVKQRSLKRNAEQVGKVILENVNARFPAGEVSVIMGPSGVRLLSSSRRKIGLTAHSTQAGKSSLLQILAGRLSSGTMSDFCSSGSILLNGQEFGPSLASLVAFVEQVRPRCLQRPALVQVVLADRDPRIQEDAHHLPALTVRETLRYAARLRLKGSTIAQCDARAEEVLRMLGLKACADNMVGGELMKGISGGEKRRLSLAAQMISDPPVLLADEPLSGTPSWSPRPLLYLIPFPLAGLDAFTAQNVMQTLKDLASSGRTLIVSVHQPRSDIWAMFDNVLLLVKGGKSAYSGPTDGILKALESAGEVCPHDFNPADFILDVVSVDHRSVEAEKRSSQRVSHILDTWTARASALSAGGIPEHGGMSAKLRNTPFTRSFPVVLGRSFKLVSDFIRRCSPNLRRQQEIFVARIANPPFMALLFWLFFARLGYGPSSAQDRIGLLQETTALPFVGMLSCIAIFPFERELYFHEYKSSGRHSVTTFLLAYTVQETAVSIFSSLVSHRRGRHFRASGASDPNLFAPLQLFSIIFQYGMNMQTSARIFVEFWFSSYALISAGESIGIIFSAFCNNGGLAVSLVSAGLTLLAQLNGIISATLDEYLKIIGWSSSDLAHEASSRPHHDQRDDRQVKLRSTLLERRTHVLTCSPPYFTGLRFNCTDADIASGACIATTGEQVLDVFQLPYGQTGKYMGILMSLVVIWRLLAWGALRLRVAYL